MFTQINWENLNSEGRPANFTKTFGNVNYFINGKCVDCPNLVRKSMR